MEISPTVKHLDGCKYNSAYPVSIPVWWHVSGLSSVWRRGQDTGLGCFNGFYEGCFKGFLFILVVMTRKYKDMAVIEN